MEKTKKQTTKTNNQLMVKVMEGLKSMEKIEYKDIKSFKQLPIYILDTIKEMNNTFRNPLFEFGNKVINVINPNTKQRFIYEVEFLCENKTLANSRILWCCIEKNNWLHPMGLGKDPININIIK